MIKLSALPTTPPKKVNKEKILKETKALKKRIGELHRLLMAEGKHAILIVFQGMDASGKDGATRRVFDRCGPTGLSAYSFKKPTDEEFAHDFLWRVHKQAPAKGTIKIFNRSHYEDVLIQRVHGWIDKKRVDQRIDAINAFENLLTFDNNTTVIKFYMHISKKRQAEKLQERLDDPSKNWKHNDNDWKEAKFWTKYMNAYQDVINRSKIKWNIVPVDSRWYRDYIVAKTVVKHLEKLKMVSPVLPKTKTK